MNTSALTSNDDPCRRARVPCIDGTSLNLDLQVPVEQEGRRYSGFNLFDPDDETLLCSIVRGEFNISGLQLLCEADCQLRDDDEFSQFPLLPNNHRAPGRLEEPRKLICDPPWFTFGQPYGQNRNSHTAYQVRLNALRNCNPPTPSPRERSCC